MQKDVVKIKRAEGNLLLFKILSRFCVLGLIIAVENCVSHKKKLCDDSSNK